VRYSRIAANHGVTWPRKEHRNYQKSRILFLFAYTPKRTPFECASVVLLVSDSSEQSSDFEKKTRPHFVPGEGRYLYPVLNTVDCHQDGWQKVTESDCNRNESTSLRIIIKPLPVTCADRWKRCTEITERLHITDFETVRG